jgi:glycerophosphoryl diester phosphodiesterase
MKIKRPIALLLIPVILQESASAVIPGGFWPGTHYVVQTAMMDPPPTTAGDDVFLFPSQAMAVRPLFQLRAHPLDVEHVLTNQMEEILIVGHRGAPKSAIENTLKSFKNAVELGADAVELDLRHSADKEIVVHHNEKTSDDRKISATNWNGSGKNLKGLGLTTLSEVFQLLRHIRSLRGYPVKFLLDIKENGTLPHNVLQIIRRMHLEERVIMIGQENVLEKIRRENSEIAVSVIALETLRESLDLLKRLNAQYLFIGSDRVTPDNVQRIHDEGFRVGSFGNKIEVLERFVRASVNLISTDYPERATSIHERPPAQPGPRVMQEAA